MNDINGNVNAINGTSGNENRENLLFNGIEEALDILSKLSQDSVDFSIMRAINTLSTTKSKYKKILDDESNRKAYLDVFIFTEVPGSAKDK